MSVRWSTCLTLSTISGAIYDYSHLDRYDHGHNARQRKDTATAVMEMAA